MGGNPNSPVEKVKRNRLRGADFIETKPYDQNVANSFTLENAALQLRDRKNTGNTLLQLMTGLAQTLTFLRL
jgi:hypothetical protein